MPRRTTPRPRHEVLEIVRALRKRYITPEAEAAARAALARTPLPLPGMPRPAAPPVAAAAPAEPSLIDLIRRREGIAVGGEATGEFTDAERDRARQILARLQAKRSTTQ
jgi:hypothetical protein